jgi:hypothetical protein
LIAYSGEEQVVSDYQKPWTDAGGCIHNPADASKQKRIVLG